MKVARQRLSLRMNPQRSTKSGMQTKTRALQNLKSLAPRATSNIKHSVTSSQVNINPYINGLLTLVPITQCIFVPATTKLQGMPKEGLTRQETKIHNLKRQSIKIRLRYDIDVEL